MNLKLKICLFLLIKISVMASGEQDFYSFDVEDPEGNKVSLEKYRGKVTLVVNVASLCGYTEGTYRAITRLHDILGYDGFFSVLAFPCNQFGEQEPGEASEIVTNMEKEYEIEFPIFNKIDVTGPDGSPAFKNLIEQSSVVPDWNFYKYLVDGNGKVINTWGTRTTIEEIFEVIQTAVDEAKNLNKKSSESDGEKDKNKDEL